MARKESHSELMPLFLMANISRGALRSLYEFQSGVGLQPGGVNPVLRRLEEDGLVDRRPQERRRRREIKLTEPGEAFLSSQWMRCLHYYPDGESCLRAAYVAVLMAKLNIAEAYLRGMADEYERNLPVRSKNQGKRQDPNEWYASARETWERARRRCAAAVFRRVAARLKEMNSQ